MPLGPAQQRRASARAAVDDLLGDLVDQAQLVDEPRVDPGGVVDLLGGRPGAERVHHLAQPPVVRVADLLEQRVLVELDAARWLQSNGGVACSPGERSAFCSASVKLRPIAIASPTDFMCVVSVGSAAGNFSKANRGTFTTT